MSPLQSKVDSLIATLESLVDAHGLRTVLVALSEVCGEREDREERSGSPPWRKCALLIDRCAESLCAESLI